MNNSKEDNKKTARGWSAAYPVDEKDAIQKLLDPLLDCWLFSGAIFVLIIYSMYNLYQSYQAQTPLELEQLRQVSLLISGIFMLEFLMKFASRRFAYLKKEGIVDFLAASDFFSPAVRATKFVRFLRVLRLLRVIRGAKMIKRRASRIEDDIFTSFSTATIIVMLVFVAVKSHYDWRTTKDRVHERLLPVLASIEKQLQTDDEGIMIASDDLTSAEIALVEHPDFVSASHTPLDQGNLDWQLAARRQVDRERLSQILKEIKGQMSVWTDVPTRDKTFVEKRVLRTLHDSPTSGILSRIKQDLYLRRHHAENDAVRGALGNALALLESVPVYLSRVEQDKIGAYLKEMNDRHFPETILTIRRENASGTLTYRFLLDDEYIESREDEFVMLVAAFALIIVMVLVLNITLKDLISKLEGIDHSTTTSSKKEDAEEDTAGSG